MPNAIPCSSCGVDLDCPEGDPLGLYTLEGPAFATSLVCPDGYNCGLSRFVRMVCCDSELETVFNKGISAAQRATQINTLIENCRVAQESCGSAASILYYNAPKTASFTCSSYGQTGIARFTYELPAGSYLASSLALANQYAQGYANDARDENHFCVAVPVIEPCVGDAVSVEIPIRGGTDPFAVTIDSGSLPPGLVVMLDGRQVTISGTPIAMGEYSFVLRVNDSFGGYWEQTVEIDILC